MDEPDALVLEVPPAPDGAGLQVLALPDGDPNPTVAALGTETLFVMNGACDIAETDAMFCMSCMSCGPGPNS